MKVAIFPGSFSGWHQGHQDVLNKALLVFDKVVVMQLSNPDKVDPLDIMDTLRVNPSKSNVAMYSKLLDYLEGGQLSFKRVKNMLLVKAIENVQMGQDGTVCAVVKGLRNGIDLEYEIAMQYNNEDLGIQLPTFYVVCDRDFRHISSTAIRQIEKFRGRK